MLYNEHNLAVAKFAATDEARPELTGVLFTRDKTIATDSYRLLEVSVPNDVKVEDYPKTEAGGIMRGTKPFIVSADMLKEIKLPHGRSASSLPIFQNMGIKHIHSNRIEFLTTNLETADIKIVRRIEGKFPGYQQVFPVGEPVAEVMINSKYLAELVAIMGKLNVDVKMKLYGADKPIVLETGNGKQKARGMLMPIKT